MYPLQRMVQSLKYFGKTNLLVFLMGCAFVKISFAVEVNSSAKELAKKNGCLSCHSENKKIIGPAFRDIAEKYRDSSSAQPYVIARIKNGGSGIWGVVAMPANKNISDQDLEKITQWVLNH